MNGMVSTFCNLWLILLLAAVARSTSFPAALDGKKIFDVRKYGARGDGQTDSAMAFTKAWNEACEWKGNARVYVPFGTFYLSGATFMGPCISRISFIIKGTLLAPKDADVINEDAWIMFKYVDYLTVTGGGILDGQGSYSWPHNDCKKNSRCRTMPVNIAFSFVKFSRVHHITSVNSKMGHFSFFAAQNFNITQVNISAPGDSPNTDGIKIGSSIHMKIHNVTIATGDDCIAILAGTTDLDISGVTCGPGHGISVGSLGKFKEEKSVEGLTVRDSIFNGTSDGVRIKTWPSSSGSPLLVSNFLYENLQMINVGNPINIDQQYCPVAPCAQKSSSQVQIQNVTYNNIWGTSKNKVAVKLQCSDNAPCKDVKLSDVNLVHSGPDGPATALCQNVGGRTRGKMFPPACI